MATTRFGIEVYDWDEEKNDYKDRVYHPTVATEQKAMVVGAQAVAAGYAEYHIYLFEQVKNGGDWKTVRRMTYEEWLHDANK